MTEDGAPRKRKVKRPRFVDPQGEPIMVVSGPSCGHRRMKFRKHGKIVEKGSK